MKTQEAKKWPPELLNYPNELPIVRQKREIINALKESRVVIVAGATGSGKSTQLPKICLEAGLRKEGFIGCTQPRRIAAISLAERLSYELKNLDTNFVGYKIRFQEKISRNTVIKYMTDGILLAEAQKDKLFQAYDVIIVDEAHERTLNIDFILGILKQLTEIRNDLSIIISSATIDPKKFSDAFDNAPIIEVPSRTYPIELRYLKEDLENQTSEDPEKTYLDLAKEALEQLITERVRGDILVFMPTEKDIREFVQQIEQMSIPNMKPYPLFARMASWQQKKIFSPTQHYKIIVATNIAETSITIPNIKAVIDTGLARMAVYSPRTGTQRLPILRISKASADQRKGRCGRTSPGICIRLYTEDEYNNMPDFTPPEIRRSSLAEIILRMIYLKLGDVTSFPFIDPPPKSAIKEGYTVLKELGAIYEKDSETYLTKTGKLMARLPLEPRLSRILLESINQGAFNEVLVIVSALSIQDPRERPFGQEDAADAAHARFIDPRSDFLTILKIWSAYQREIGQNCSRTGLRRWCAENFISYRRLQEWISVHDELFDIVKESVKVPRISKHADYASIHKSLLAGFITRIAMHEGKGKYRGPKGREIYIFPGSSVKGNPQWIMAAEIVETSRTFARMVANIDPLWIEEVAPHLCSHTYYEPHWDAKKGNVVAYEKVTLYGLPVVENRPVIYGKINQREAHEIFIKDGLIEHNDKLNFEFIQHNRRVIEQLLNTEEKIRKKGLISINEVLYKFYSEKIPKSIWSIWAFRKFLRSKKNQEFLKISIDDFLKNLSLENIEDLYPGHIRIGNEEFSLRYCFSPGSEEDGVTIIIPVQCLNKLESEPFEWLVPGYLEDKVLFLLKNLPKNKRRSLIPISEVSKKVTETLRKYKKGNFYELLSKAVLTTTGVTIEPSMWPRDKLPDFLKFRFEVISPDGTTLAAARNLDKLKREVPVSYEDTLWKSAKAKLEIESLDSLPEKAVPEYVEIGRDASGKSRYAYFALVDEGGRISLRIFPTPEEAREANQKGILAIIIKVLEPYLKKLSRGWVIPQKLIPATFFMGTPKAVSEEILKFIIKDIFALHSPLKLNVTEIKKKLEEVKPKLAILGSERFDMVCKVLEYRYLLLKKLTGYRNKPGFAQKLVHERMDVLEKELDYLVPKNFLDLYSFEDLKRCLHYLKALEIRIDRAYVSPEKDRAKSERLESELGSLCQLSRFCKASRNLHMKWAIEDYKLTIFAPEIKPLIKTDIKKLGKMVQSCVQSS